MQERRRRIGRPPGPSANRAIRQRDPIQLWLHEYAILRFVAAHPEMPRWSIAERFGISVQRLSLITCCSLGQCYLKALRELHRLEGRDFETLLKSPDSIREILGPGSVRF